MTICEIGVGELVPGAEHGNHRRATGPGFGNTRERGDPELVRADAIARVKKHLASLDVRAHRAHVRAGDERVGDGDGV